VFSVTVFTSRYSVAASNGGGSSSPEFPKCPQSTSEMIQSHYNLFYVFEAHYNLCNNLTTEKPYVFSEIFGMKIRVLGLGSDYRFNDVVTIYVTRLMMTRYIYTVS
jgi:hypothetical protein